MLELVAYTLVPLGVAAMPIFLFWQWSKIRWLRDELRRAQDRSDYWQRTSAEDSRELVKLKEAVLKAVHKE